MNKNGSKKLRIFGFDWLLWIALVLLVLWIGWRNNWMPSAAIAMGIFIPMVLLLRIGIVKCIRIITGLQKEKPKVAFAIESAENGFRIIFIIAPMLLALWVLWIEFRP